MFSDIDSVCVRVCDTHAFTIQEIYIYKWCWNTQYTRMYDQNESITPGKKRAAVSKAEM